MKTTVLLRDDIHSILLAKFGKRGVSQAINDILFEQVVASDGKSMFGADPWLARTSRKDLRDHDDRNI